ncbi:hypothetical protein GCM10022416_11860 [Actinomadura keratinilytica]|uniref:DUF1062 domain-containing protein n=1 Tax=Actinomadura keratinilytica TaxID=547461 RepID=A0ABP7Y874_9ACTN
MTPRHRREQRNGADRAAELLAWLQLGTCARCGRARYPSRREARQAARLAAPGVRLRAYRCGTSWHLTTPAGRPQLIAPPVTVAPQQGRQVRGLDLGHRGERAYGGRRPDVPIAKRDRPARRRPGTACPAGER